MTQQEFTKTLAKRSGVTQRAAKRLISALPHALLAALRVGGRLQPGGLGVFRVSARKPRLVTPPKGGKAVSLPASKTVKFRVAKKIKVAL